MQTNEHKLLVGAEVGWLDRSGELLTGTVTSYRSPGGRLQLQIKRLDGSHLWFLIGALDRRSHDRFCIIRYASLMEYGLTLADDILRGHDTRRPSDPRLTTLAATIVALETELRQARDVPETPKQRGQSS